MVPLSIDASKDKLNLSMLKPPPLESLQQIIDAFVVGDVTYKEQVRSLPHLIALANIGHQARQRYVRRLEGIWNHRRLFYGKSSLDSESLHPLPTAQQVIDNPYQVFWIGHLVTKVSNDRCTSPAQRGVKQPPSKASVKVNQIHFPTLHQPR